MLTRYACKSCGNPSIATPVRHVAMWWATIIETTLRRNDFKPHWDTLPLSTLFVLLLVEVAELADALSGTDRIAIRDEAADVAALAMMIADRVSDRPTLDRGRQVPHD